MELFGTKEYYISDFDHTSNTEFIFGFDLFMGF